MADKPKISEKEFRKRYQEALTEADIRIKREALQHSLDIQHRTMLIAFFTALIALTVGIVAIVHKPDVTVQVVAPKTSHL